MSRFWSGNRVLDDLTKHLHSNGIDDHEFWLPQLKELGVKSKESLSHLEGEKDEFSKLDAKARNPVEKKALRKLLKIDELEKKVEDESKEKSEGKKKERIEKEEKAQEQLKELKKAVSELQESHDKRVKEVESNVRDSLQISPDSWIHDHKSLDEAIKKLEEGHQVSGKLQTRGWLSESELLMKCSGGRALKGILLVNQLHEKLRDKDFLLEVPQNIMIAGDSISKDRIEQFSSQHQEDNYKKLVDVFGLGASGSGSAPVYGSFAVNLGGSFSYRSEDETTQEKSTKELYASTIKYSTVRVASFTFKERDLRLSKEATKKLKEILRMLKIDGVESSRVKGACKQFFMQYGSHANRGPISFGGRLRWVCSTRGFSEEERNSVKNMQSMAISASGGVSSIVGGYGASASMNMESVSGSFKGKSVEKHIAMSTLEINVVGGPPETADVGLWKSGLVASNKTWILTDRGSKFIAVWEIIKINHEKELGDVRDVLRKTWERMTELKAEPDYLVSLSHDSDTVLKEVNDWINDKCISPEQIEKYLEYLLKVRRDIIKEANPVFWITEFILQPSVQAFLLVIMELNLTPHLHRIKFLVKQLLEQDELSEQNMRDFQGIKQVYKWLYGPSQRSTYEMAYENVIDFESFTNFLKKKLDNDYIALLSVNDSEQRSRVASQLANNVSKAINHLRFHYKQTYDDVLIVALVSPFLSGGESDIMTLRPITLKDLNSLFSIFSKERQAFLEYNDSERHVLNLQAYLLQLAADHSCKNQLNQLLQQLQRMIDQLHSPLKPELARVLGSYFQGSSLMQLKQTLCSLMTAAPKPKPMFSIENSLQNILTQTEKALSESSSSVSPDESLSSSSQENIEESVSSVSQENPNASALLKKLGLCKHYPKGLHLEDALCIKLEPLQFSINKTSPTDPQILPQLILHKIMAYDSLCRSDLMPVVEAEDEDDDCYSAHSDESKQGRDSDVNYSSCSGTDHITGGLHPVDSLLSLIICSDDFLRQDLFSRLAKCQLAVPFILPDPFTKKLTLPLWGLRSIIKEWDCSTHGQGSDGKVKKIQPIISYEMPIVTFIRLGKSCSVRSKSALLNEVISDSHYDHFFHRDCTDANYNLVLGDGLVDMCWFLPGKIADAFPDAVTFLNLHGDGEEHPEQMRFLSQISSMCFVLLTEEDLELDGVTSESLENFNSSAGGITVLSNIKNVPEYLKKKTLIDLTTNASGVKDAIRSQINEKLDFSSAFHSIENCCNAQNQGEILIDEHNGPYQQGLTYATEVITLITSHQSQISAHKAKPDKKDDDKSIVKDTLLPLQGDTLWRAWAANDKEMHRQFQRGSNSVLKYTESIESEKADIRKKQLEHLRSISPAMNSFILSLLRLGGSSNKVLRNYFLQCLKLGLTNLSQESMVSIQYQYQAARKEMSMLKENTISQDDTAIFSKMFMLKKRLEDLQQEITSSSFNLEHLFREIGQMYEAAASAPQPYRDSLGHLPKAAAELLVDGYPLELMDGDAAHVPLQWVTAVLEETTKILGDPNVFVLSVLGLQSTGKSTLLNTVFGLQFNVGAGMCTHGAFMQLLPLDDELKTQTNCSYVLVVDTEGLCAPQLDPLIAQKHDNELATFVIGLANMTLINIYGKVPGDMDDILQTSVHAFIRMTQLKFSPSCQLVLHNTAANGSSEADLAKFTSKLDQVTVEAAKRENCGEKFKCFSDVIKFNHQSDVHHFPGLWKGDPPMASVSQGYSQSAQFLKLRLIEILSKKSINSSPEETAGSLRLSALRVKIQSLWKTLLEENFAFSFKNTQEMTAYHSLETEYSKWEWELQKGMLKWEQAAEKEFSAKNSKSTSELAREKCKMLPHHITTLYKPIKAKMRAFFSGKQSKIFVQWEAKFERKLDNFKGELKSHAETHCMKLGQSREAVCKFEQKRKSYAAIIKSQVQDYIAAIKEEQEEFSKNWQQKCLSAHLVERILQRKVFTSESLQIYRQQGIITNDKVSAVQAIIDKCVGNLTSVQLEEIMFSILGKRCVEEILTKGRQTEEDLKMKFSDIWNDLITQLPYVSGESMHVEHKVKAALFEFVRRQSYEGQLIAIVQEGKNDLRRWGARFELPLVENTRYINPNFQHFIIFGDSEIRATAHAMTQRVLNAARECLKAITERKTDFKPGFAQELLHEVDAAITKETEAVKEQLAITPEYRCTMLLVVCEHAIPQFEEMAELFMEQTNPRFYLDKHLLKPLFTKFKNQYYQTIEGEAIANDLCTQLKSYVEDQIKNTLGAVMAARMRASEPHFTSKMALKVKILTDLYEEDTFKSYKAYFFDDRIEYLQSRIKQYTVEYADEKISGGTRLQIIAKEEVSRLIGAVECAVTEVNKTDIQEWMTTFSESLKIHLIKVSKSFEGIDLEDFKQLIRNGLQKMKESLYSVYSSIEYERENTKWNNKPHSLLYDLIGCTESCPFCGEQCDLLDPNHFKNERQKHRTAIHRPMCVEGWKTIQSGVMEMGFCPTKILVKDENFLDKETNMKFPYNKYSAVYPEWSILADPTSENCLYWKWFVGKYVNDIAKKFKAKPADVPEDWLHIRWPEMAKSLGDAYKVEVPE